VSQLMFSRLRSSSDERLALAETLAHLRHLERGGRVREIAGSPTRWTTVRVGSQEPQPQTA
jgi:hypothetical protein